MRLKGELQKSISLPAYSEYIGTEDSISSYNSYCHKKWAPKEDLLDDESLRKQTPTEAGKRTWWSSKMTSPFVMTLWGHTCDAKRFPMIFHFQDIKNAKMDERIFIPETSDL